MMMKKNRKQRKNIMNYFNQQLHKLFHGKQLINIKSLFLYQKMNLLSIKFLTNTKNCRRINEKTPE